ncbi:MAG TPA: hypothetical protein VMS64_10470 [Candidatus Methylomirabilis sp.]|nr:hypothetical protein [Candidatus Methylomirabilis sp.]
MTTERGVRLESADGQILTAVTDINAALSKIGAGVWPLDLAGAPDDIRRLLGQPTLTDVETKRVLTQFLLSRERLLEIIGRTGRRPNVPGGGEMATFVSNEGYSYPQIWVMRPDADYARFDRLHVNTADDGTGVDEVLQILWGGGVVIRLRFPDRSTRTLRLACPREGAGWLATYDGGQPHIGSLSDATPGTKVMVQAIGPARWALRYVE